VLLRLNTVNKSERKYLYDFKFDYLIEIAIECLKSVFHFKSTSDS